MEYSLCDETWVQYLDKDVQKRGLFQQQFTARPKSLQIS